MDSFNKLLQFLKDRSLFQEFIFLGLGLVLLFLLNIFFSPPIDRMPNFHLFTSLLLSILILVGGYFFALICFEIGGAANKIVFFLLKGERKDRLKKNLKDLYNYINSSGFQLSQDELNRRQVLEAVEGLSNKSLLHNKYVVAHNKIIISYTLYGFTFFLLFGEIFFASILTMWHIVFLILVASIFSLYRKHQYDLTTRKLTAIYERHEQS